MKKIGIYTDFILEEKIKNFFPYEFFNAEKLKKDIILDAVIIDINTENIDKKLHEYYNLNIPIILLIGEEDSINMRKYFVNRIIKDYVLRNNLEQLGESLSFHGKSCSQFINIFLKDSCRTGIIKAEEIEYINYSSISRETEFHLKGNKIFSIKRKFSEIEKIQEKIQNFIKLERGMIINLSLVSFLNYREEKIVFKSGDFLYLSRLKLKKLEKCLQYSKENSFFL